MKVLLTLHAPGSSPDLKNRLTSIGMEAGRSDSWSGWFNESEDINDDIISAVDTLTKVKKHDQGSSVSSASLCVIIEFSDFGQTVTIEREIESRLLKQIANLDIDLSVSIENPVFE